MNWLFLIIGIISGIVITLLVIGITMFIREKMLYSSSPLTGDWYDEICGNDGDLNKVDIYSLKHNIKTNQIKGVIHRVKPVEQNYRRCNCRGVFDSNHMILMFWPIRKKNTSRVNGCIYLKLVEDDYFEGAYLTEHSGRIDATTIYLKKNL